MATMYPSEIRPNNGHVPSSEKRIFDLLKANLSHDYEVVWSFVFKIGTHDYEADFVIIHKDKPGFLVLEVKGGAVRLENSKWQQKRISDKTWIECTNPVKQANRARWHIVEKLGGKKEGIWGRIGLVFPDAKLDLCSSNASSNEYGGVHRHQIIDASGCRDITITTSIDKIFDKERQCDTEKQKNENLRVLEVIKPHNEFSITLGGVIRETHEVWKRFSEQQKGRMREIEKRESKHGILQGAAGSGKTIIAMEAARRASKKGLRTLYLCHNNILQNRVFFQLKFEEMIDVLDVSTLGTLMGSSKEIFSSLDLYDAIFLDEAQDFFEEDWCKIKQLYNTDHEYSTFWIFHDPAQTLRKGENRENREKRTLVCCARDEGWQDISNLEENIRNTKKIGKFAAKMIEYDMKFEDETPDGFEINEEAAFSPRELVYRVLNCVDKWQEDGIKEDRIAVVVGGQSESINGAMKTISKKLCIGYNRTIPLLIDMTKRGRNMWSNAVVDDSSIPIYCSASRLKGIDVDAVLLIVPPNIEIANARINYYVGATRAQHILNVIQVPFDYSWICGKFWNYYDDEFDYDKSASKKKGASNVIWRETEIRIFETSICISLGVTQVGVHIFIRPKIDFEMDTGIMEIIEKIRGVDLLSREGAQDIGDGLRFFAQNFSADMREPNNWPRAARWVHKMHEEYLACIELCFEEQCSLVYDHDHAARARARERIIANLFWCSSGEIYRGKKKALEELENDGFPKHIAEFIVKQEVAEIGPIEISQKLSEPADQEIKKEIELISKRVWDRREMQNTHFLNLCKTICDKFRMEIDEEDRDISEVRKLCFQAIKEELKVNQFDWHRFSILHKILDEFFPQTCRDCLSGSCQEV